MSDTTTRTPVSNPFYILFGLLWDFVDNLVPWRFFTYLNLLSLTHMANLAVSIFANLAQGRRWTLFELCYDSLGPVWGFPTNFGYLVDLLFKLEVIQNFRPVRFSPGLFLVLYGLGERGFNSFCCTYGFLKLPPSVSEVSHFLLPFFRFWEIFFRSMATLALPLFGRFLTVSCSLFTEGAASVQPPPATA